MSIKRGYDVSSAWVGSVARMGAGLVARTPGRQPDKLLALYEYESCPYCRRVREVLTELDIGAMIYPCPRGGMRYRSLVRELGGKAQFPFLVDPNTGSSMYESNDIIRYLCQTYGDAKPSPLTNKPLSLASGAIMSLARPGCGGHARRSRCPDQPLELWSFEASPYCRLVREALCELELPYRLHNVAKKSRHRKAFIARSGKMMVPYLADPNTGVEMFESEGIVGYLKETYAL